ncbi:MULTISPECIES: alpha/beta hydrolase [Streptomyces]|uniref:alpha/beta hydrolase n=1 Tax=Streptomyces scabiei TaxID=1930 RepID=UPI001F192CD8|nr:MULTISPECIES: alpha/beta hydrolase [Streptomyces]MDX2688189.1 alpha/beta hydrolase [Streptomyces scabiei]MDX2753291.1 alpha/beta hydrolase [Streptomyces scabiei]MDX2807493.1 alpha/beta hydrolase [Streptomyces scabiei]MDX2829280.1 alpha/beta hydrolase [Streptomyces scabiei]MDX3028768.1 alpha/beta hydrolase [Streptomyces scabiei]
MPHADEVAVRDDRIARVGDAADVPARVVNAMSAAVDREGTNVHGDLRNRQGAAVKVSQHDSLDPELRAPLEELLENFPGGVCAIEDLAERRRIDAMHGAETAEAVKAVQTCSTEDVWVPGPVGCADVPVRVYRPRRLQPAPPAVFFIHGGGMCLGDIDYEHGAAVKICEELGALVVSTGYRKAPEHPHPAQVDDCYAALRWMSDNATSLDFDPGRLAVFGGSAGGNLALATALKARDLAGPALSYVMALYPMVDHRNTTPSAHEVTEIGAWDRKTNVEAWEWFLAGQEPDGYAAPLHAEDLSGLPPTFIDVGTADVFRDEDLALAQRLLAAGVTTELHVYPGVYHAAEHYAPDAEAARHMWAVRFRALRRALGIQPVRIDADGSTHDH